MTHKYLQLRFLRGCKLFATFHNSEIILSEGALGTASQHPLLRSTRAQLLVPSQCSSLNVLRVEIWKGNRKLELSFISARHEVPQSYSVMERILSSQQHVLTPASLERGLLVPISKKGSNPHPRPQRKLHASSSGFLMIPFLCCPKSTPAESQKA